MVFVYGRSCCYYNANYCFKFSVLFMSKEFSLSVYPRSMVSATASVNKSAKLKTDVRYLWNKFVIDNGGVEEATKRCYNDLMNLNKQGGYCDVSGVNFTNPVQAISQVVGDIKEKQSDLKKQQEEAAKQQQSDVTQSAPASDTKSE